MVQRKCIVTNSINDVDKMIRIVKTKNGDYFIDSKEKGRGSYILKDKSLIPIVLKKKVLHKTFKTNVSKEVYERLIKKLEDLDEK